MDSHLYYSHSLQVWRDAKASAVNVFAGEMNMGGWNPIMNYDARLLKYVLSDKGASVQREQLYQGEGTHEAMVADIDGDGVPEIIGALGSDQGAGRGPRLGCRSSNSGPRNRPC